MPNYHLNKRWKKVDDATDCPNVFATMSGTSGNYVSDLSGAEIYSLLQENPKQVIFLKDTNGRACPLTTPPTSGASNLKFSILIGTTLYEYTIASGGNAISVSTTNVSGSSNNIFIFHISRDLTSGYTMDTTWSAIAEAKSAGKLIVANPGTDKVYYDCGDPLDEGISLSRVFPAPSGLKVDSFTISSDGTITYSGEVPVTAENVVKYTEQSLSSAQKAQACANIGATKKTEVGFSYTGTDALCSMTYSALSTAKSNGELLVPRYINMYGSMSVGSNGVFVFNIPTVDLSAELLVIYTFTVDSEDNVEYNESEFSIHAGISDDVKTALLNCFAHVAWDDTNGQSRYDALEAAMYPETHLVSITASYDQDHPIYLTDTWGQVCTTIGYDLVVTAHYSDGTDEVLSSSDYELSGTLAVGTNTVTVTYQGKTDTISVLVIEKWTYSIDDFTKVTGTLGNASNADCGIALSTHSGTSYRRSFMLLSGETSVALSNNGGSTISSQTSDYYPFKIPAGAKSFSVSITPNTQFIQVLTRQLNDGVYSALPSTGWTGYTQGSGSKSFDDGAVGDNGYFFLTTKYNSAGTSYPTEPTALDVVFSDT